MYLMKLNDIELSCQLIVFEIITTEVIATDNYHNSVIVILNLTRRKKKRFIESSVYLIRFNSI